MEITLFGKDLDIRRRRAGLLHLRPINVGAGERILSALAGAGLVLWGLRRRSVAGVLTALAGGSGLLRAVTGHCELNEAIGRNSARMLR